MELSYGFRVTPAEGDRPGAYASFPYDRDLVERFREAFPRARWRQDEDCWFVPGITATHRLDVWMSRQLADLDRHADAKGRDAFAFDPLQSRYLKVGEDLGVCTPYSRTIVETMRRIPWARWDPEARIWRVPFRSFEELRARWPTIEEAAERNEPEARRQRRVQRSEPIDPQKAALGAERRRRRYPVPADDLPPLDIPLATFGPGVVVFEETGSEPFGADAVPARYPHIHETAAAYVWARWRVPALQELYRARPAREPADETLKLARGWWFPDRSELRERIRRVRQIERTMRSRMESGRVRTDG
jgi:hypothetical protein